MMNQTSKHSALALFVVAAVALASCNGNGGGGDGGQMGDSGSSDSTAITTVQAQRTTAFATVQAINLSAGTLTLQWSDTGMVNTYRAGPNALHIEQLHVGDVVKASVAESLAVYIGPDAANPSSGGGNDVRIVPDGDASALLLAHTYVMSERVVAVDTFNRTVTVQPASGPPRTLQLTPNLDMSTLQVGEMVVMRVSEAIAMAVEQQ